MNNFEIEKWLPMEPQKGPPLPKSMQIYWPWYKPPEVPPEAPIYACPYCPAEFATEEELYDHIREAHPAQPPKIIYMCPYCGAKFDTMTALQEHMAIAHPPPKVYTCPYCGAQFATEAELNYHIQIAHPPEVPPVFPPEVADIRVESLTIEPVECYVGQSVQISVVARNYGGASGSKVITCDVNGKVSKQTVSLGAGVSQAVTFTATPQEAKTYQVSVNGLTSSFKAVPGDRFYMPATMEAKVTDGTILDMYWQCDFRVPITNNGVTSGTHTVTCKDSLGRQWSEQITLQPGETYTLRVTKAGQAGWYIDFRRITPPYTIEATGDWEGDNYSKGEARP